MNEAIVLLLLLWAVLLLPSALRSRNSSPHSTVGGFARAMDVLRAKPGHGRELMVPGDASRIVSHGRSRDTTEEAHPRGEDPVVSRRRSWFLRLLGGTGTSLLLAVVVGGWLWLPFVMLALVTGGYVSLLRHLKLQHDRARQVVRDLELRRPSPEPHRAEEPPELASADGMGIGTVRLRRWDA